MNVSLRSIMVSPQMNGYQMVAAYPGANIWEGQYPMTEHYVNLKLAAGETSTFAHWRENNSP